MQEFCSDYTETGYSPMVLFVTVVKYSEPLI